MIKKYQRTQNLISMEMLSNDTNMDAGGVMYPYNGRVGTDTDIDVSSLNNVTVSVDLVGKSATLYFIYAIFNGTTLIDRVAGNLTGTSINTTNATILRLCFYINNDSIDKTNLAKLMVNEGSTAKPYQPYYDWITIPYRKFTTATEAVENPLYTDGTAITSYTVKGNTLQNGTPTPSNPVDVNGVGVRTENLWNEDYTGISDTVTYKAVYVGDGQFTMSNNKPRTSDLAALLFLLAGNVSSGASSSMNGVWDEQSRTVTSIDGYVTIAYRTVRTYTPVGSQTMLNSGSTAKPYEPYGYKIPISSGGVTTNIYLGSTQTVRQIKKLVLTGQEDWQVQSTNQYGIANYRLFISNDDACLSGKALSYCTHYEQQQSGIADTTTIGFLWAGNTPSKTIYIRELAADYANATAFKAYLAAQYAAGTPVTIWYVLTTPETAAVNEPLMKIGDYADTLSNATSIPTTEGANSISVDTTVQPSEFTATWTGWHDSSVKEWDGSQWQ